MARGRGRPGWGRRAAVWLVVHRARILALVALLSILVGGALYLSGEHAAASDVWFAAVALLATELAFEVVRTVIVDRHMGVDTIALVAMVGALALGEEFAGVIIGLMFSGGQTLEDVASTRARRELTALVQRAPKVAQLRVGDRLEQVPVAQVRAGDVVVVRTGEVVPVDGVVVGGEAVVDTSTLSGEPLPVTVGQGMPVLSGSANAGSPFDVRADRPAAESAYAALVRLVEQAQAHRAPFVRMADRYAGFFLPATLIVAALAWAISGDPVRALAVVVVATPCPLILAAPIALVSGLSRAARCGVIVKGAGAIETLGEARTVLFDKTGTLTVGTPEVRDIVTTAIANPGSCSRSPPRSIRCPLTCSVTRSYAPRSRRASRSSPRPMSMRYPVRASAGWSTATWWRSEVERSCVRLESTTTSSRPPRCYPATARARHTCSSASTAMLVG